MADEDLLRETVFCFKSTIFTPCISMPFRDRLRTHINTKSRPGYPTGFDLAALKQTLKDHIKSIESRLMNCGQDLMEIHERQQGKMKGAKYFLQSVFVNSAKESLLK